MTADTFCVVSKGLIVTLVAAPTVAMATKRATEDVPHVGKVVQRIPTSVYASLVTLIVVLVQHTRYIYIYIYTQRRSKEDVRTALKVRTSLRLAPYGSADGALPPQRPPAVSPVTFPSRVKNQDSDEMQIRWPPSPSDQLVVGTGRVVVEDSQALMELVGRMVEMLVVWENRDCCFYQSHA
ncbi:hypothetical protein ACLB2K_068749 [Fragaria x ananassa]